jgi:hypothetical protein
MECEESSFDEVLASRSESFAPAAERADFGAVSDDADDAPMPAKARKRSAPMREAEKKKEAAPKGGAGAAAAGPQGGEDTGAWLARTQGADGSYGGDVARTAAALLLLLIDGNTRRKGLRRRTVAKAAAWLALQQDALATLALQALDAAEAGTRPIAGTEWSALFAGGDEGSVLARGAQA